jgi:peptidoglycan/LPS O-acetylase OafA/YrhL
VSPSAVIVRITPVHLRPPSIDPGITSFVWAFVLGVLLWAFMLAVGVSKPTAFIVAALAGCVIFVYVRRYGEDEPRRKSR